jgi:hypothetical protein
MSAPRLPTLSDIWRDPVGSVVNIAVNSAAASTGVTTVMAAAPEVANQLPTIAGEKTLKEQAADAKKKQEEDAAGAEANARATAVNDALSDKTLDAKTRQELLALYQGGAASPDIANKLNEARAGKGIYGVRRVNQNQLALMRAMPGRQQVLSLGTGSAIG